MIISIKFHQTLIIPKCLYLVTDFNQDGRSDNISFMIKRIKVHSGDALRDPNYRFPGNYGVEKYLELFSGKLILVLEFLHHLIEYCLNYLITFNMISSLFVCSWHNQNRVFLICSVNLQ